MSHAGRKDKNPYFKVGFLIKAEDHGRFWEGHEARYTPATLAHFNALVEADRLEWEKKAKHSFKKMSNERWKNSSNQVKNN